MVALFGWKDVFYETQIIDFVAFIASARLMRQIATTTKPFADAYPLPSFLVFVFSMMTPGLFINLCVDESILTTITSPTIWIYSLLSYWLVFFSPRDFFWELVSTRFGSLIVDLIKDTHRVLVAASVTHLVSDFPGQHYFGPFIAASIKNTIAVQVLYVVEQLVRADTVKKHDLKMKSYSFRISVFTALVSNLIRFLKETQIDVLNLSFIRQLNYSELYIRFEILILTMRVAYTMGYDSMYPNYKAMFDVKKVFETVCEKMTKTRTPSVNTSVSVPSYTADSSRSGSFDQSSLSSTPLPPVNKRKAAGGRSNAARKTTGRASK